MPHVTMTPSTYHVFIRRDGTYGVSLSVSGAIIKTAPAFASTADAETWIAYDSRLRKSSTGLDAETGTVPDLA